MAGNSITLEQQVVIQANEAIKALDNIKKSVKGLKNETSSAGDAIKTGLAFGGILMGGRKLLSFLKTANQDAMDLIETANLFEVSFGKGVEGLNKYYEKAIKFQNQLSEALGTNINESMNFQALFNSMGTSMGLDREVAYKISENFTKLGYDLASLYNTETDKAMQKLQSGLSGASTRPLRSFGIDITQSTLASTLADLGIDTSISKLNQAEKMVLRYISVIRQASVAHGDFARTLESPANQLRIFQAQCLAFRQNIGNLWQGIYQRWMPYINGIMMAINALIRVLGGLFGVKFGTSIQTATKSLGAGATGAGGIASGLKDASGSAKELKETLDLMPWDEIHNIDLGTDTSSGGGGGSSGGGGGGGGMDVDPALLNAMEEYDNMMSRVRNKATDIRDRIMEWLGFTKKINPFTNEISWEYTGMSKGAQKILTALKAIVAIGLTGKLIKLLGHLSTLKGVISGTVRPATAFQAGLASIGKTFSSIKVVGASAIETFKNIYVATDGSKLTKFSTALKTTAKGVWDLIPAVVKLGAGIAGLGISAFTTFKSMRELSDGTKGATSSFVKLGAGMAGAIASGAVIGSVIPGIGTAVGALAGGVVGLTTALIGWRTEGEKLRDDAKKNKKAVDEHIESIHQERQAVIDNANSQIQYIDYVEKLSNELKGLVDEEGNVKAGLEERAKFILGQLNDAMGTEYELIDGQIKGYGELSKSISDVIQKKKAEIVLQAYEEEYANAIKRQADLQKDKHDTQLKLNEDLKRQQEILNEINSLNPNSFYDAVKILELRKEYEDLSKGIETNKEELGKLTDEISQDNQTIIDWENLKEAVISDNNKKIGESLDDLVTKRKEGEKTTGEIISTSIQKELDEYNKLKENRAKLNEDVYNNQVETHEKALDDLIHTLTTTEELIDASNPDIVESWRQVAEYSEEEYNKNISLLPKDTATAIDNAVSELTGKQPIAKQAGADTAGAVIDGSNERVNNGTNGIVSVASAIVDGLVNGIMTATGPFGTLWNVGKQMINAVKLGAEYAGDIHSPSKVMYKIGDYLTQGLALGIKENADVAVDAMKLSMKDTLNEANKLTNGVSVNPNEYSINANKFVDYGSVSGNILSQVNITDGISDKVYTAVMNGFRNSTINVEIEAKTEEGVLLKRVQTQANQYRMQTGKAPFPTM